MEEVRTNIHHYYDDRIHELNVTYAKEAASEVPMIHRQPTISLEEVIESLLGEQMARLEEILTADKEAIPKNYCKAQPQTSTQTSTWGWA